MVPIHTVVACGHNTQANLPFTINWVQCPSPVRAPRMIIPCFMMNLKEALKRALTVEQNPLFQDTTWIPTHHRSGLWIGGVYFPHPFLYCADNKWDFKRMNYGNCIYRWVGWFPPLPISFDVVIRTLLKSTKLPPFVLSSHTCNCFNN